VEGLSETAQGCVAIRARGGAGEQRFGHRGVALAGAFHGTGDGVCTRLTGWKIARPAVEICQVSSARAFASEFCRSADLTIRLQLPEDAERQRVVTAEELLVRGMPQTIA
jgi:hypothetical protein